MARDDGSPDPGELGIEARLAALETRIAELTAEVAELRVPTFEPHRAVPGPMPVMPPAMAPTPPPLTAPPAAPWTAWASPPAVPVPPVPPAPPAMPPRPVAAVPPPMAWPAPRKAAPGGPPPLPAGWAAFAPGAQRAAPVPQEAPSQRPMPDRGTPSASGPSWSFAELEERLTGRLLAYVGGIAVLLGAVLFLSLAFTRGWIDPSGRVAIGLVGAIAVFALGAWLFETRPGQGVVATVLVGVGLGVGTVSIVGATRLYELVPVELGLVGSLVLGLAAATVAIRVDSRVVGIFGLLAVLGAPPLLGATPGPVAFALLATTLVGTMVVALQRSWRWFPGLAFALSAPQLGSWIAGDASIALGLGALAGFWLVNAIAAGGEELLRPTDRLRDTSATLIVGDAAFLVWGGFVLLDGPAAPWRALFLAGVALGHAVLAAVCIVRQGERHPFVLLVAGTGLAALTMAVPIQFQGSAVVVAWAAEAAVLAWLSAIRGHLHAGLAAATLGILAIGHFLLIEAPPGSIGRAAGAGTPFLDPAGATLAFMLGALAVSAWFLRDRRIRVTLAVIGLLLLTYTLPFELSGVALVGGWSILGVLAVAAERSGIVPPWPDDPALATTAGDGIPEPAAGLGFAGLLPTVLAIVHVALVELPIDQIGHAIRPAVPFTDQGAIGAAILVAAIIVMGAMAGRWGVRIGLLVAGGIVTYALPFELSGVALVGGWSILGVLAVAAERSGIVPPRPDGPATATTPKGTPPPALAIAGLLPLLLAMTHVALIELPFGRIGSATVPAIPFTDAGGLSAAILVAAILAMGACAGQWGVRTGALLVVGIATYALPFETAGLALLGGWSIVAVLAFAAERAGIVPAWPDEASDSKAVTATDEELRFGLAMGGFLPAVLAIGHALVVELPLTDLGHAVRPDNPFTDAGAAATAILVAASVAIGALRGRWGTRLGVLVAAGVVTYALPFELPLEWAVMGWATLSVAAYGAARLDPPSHAVAAWTGLALDALGLVVALCLISPPGRLVLSEAHLDAPVWGYLAVIALAAALAAGARWGTLRALGSWPFIAAGALLVYVVSVAIVDAFSSRAGGSTATEELAKQAQVALSVSWTLEGAITFAIALARRIGPARHWGLALLAIATAKVFLLDLASLDVAYRVLSLVGLGLLLLGSAYAYGRLRPGRIVTP